MSLQAYLPLDKNAALLALQISDVEKSRHQMQNKVTQ